MKSEIIQYLNEPVWARAGSCLGKESSRFSGLVKTIQMEKRRIPFDDKGRIGLYEKNRKIVIEGIFRNS